MRGEGKSNKLLRVLSYIALAATLCVVQADITANEESDSTLEKWSALAELPNWGGTWLPDFDYQRQEYMKNDAPWNSAAAETIQKMLAAKAEGAPYGLFLDCRPLGMPSWILGSHNAMEILFTPGRVTMLDESDGNRLRRIHTDGRQMPEDPQPAYHGYSVGHWEDGTLVVDTTAILDEVYISPDGENFGVSNGGNMRIQERIYLTDPDSLRFDLEITAPNVFTETWKTTRYYRRYQGAGSEIVEGVCLQSNSIDRADEEGKTRFAPDERGKQDGS